MSVGGIRERQHADRVILLFVAIAEGTLVTGIKVSRAVDNPALIGKGRVTYGEANSLHNPQYL